MSVVVLGMEMPTACEFCGFCRLYRETGRVWCNAKNRILCQKWENPDFTELRIDVPDWCPLRPLPEKHSDLIDRDAVVDKLWSLQATYQMLDDTRTADKILHGIFRAKQTINEAPTIVEAEGD